MQHPNKHTFNVRLKKEMKHWKQKLTIYVYNHSNICNIPIYFCNIHMKQLQHTYKISETLETQACNMCFQAQHLLAAWTKMEARQLGARRWRGVRCHGVARRLLVWSLSAARTTTAGPAVGGWSAATTGGASPSRGTRCERWRRERGWGPSHEQRVERAGDEGGGSTSDGGVCPASGARRASG